jgi:ABC-type glycerol-3-phosphate transport system permease component
MQASISNPSKPYRPTYRQKGLWAHAFKITRRVLAYISLVLVVFFVIFPFIWMILISLRPETEIVRYPPTIFPKTWTLDNYRLLFKVSDYAMWFKNSMFVATVTTIMVIALASTSAYALSRFRYRLFEIFSASILFVYMVPKLLLVVPLTQISYALKLADNLMGLVMVYDALLVAYGLWTLRTYFAGVPHELEEAAMIDGANRFQAFYKVVLPQAVPGIIATAIFVFHVAWDEYLYAAVLTYSSKNMVLSAGLATLIGSEGVNAWGLLMAASVLTTLPIVILFAFLQGFLIAGWGAGAIKG